MIEMIDMVHDSSSKSNNLVAHVSSNERRGANHVEGTRLNGISEKGNVWSQQLSRR